MNEPDYKPKILIIDDEQSVLNSLNRTLRHDFDVLLSLSGNAGLQILREQEISVILADQRMPNMTGVEFFQKAQTIQPDVERILITGYSDIEAVIDAINKGNIVYYVHKPWEPDALRIIVKRAADHYRLVQENRSLVSKLRQTNKTLQNENTLYNQELQKHYQFDQIIGKSPAMEAVFNLMRKVIPTDATVLLQGETGTGKELVARAIHFNGPRKKKPFVTQNCAALPDTLLESTLFGHKKGAFTDAVANKKGLFELADGGTIFLDEVADMSPAMQQRLLRVLQEGEIQPLGSEKIKTVDVRVISATHHTLTDDVKTGNFREDLFYRLNVFPVTLPALHNRREDIPRLVHHFVKKSALRMGKNISTVSNESLARVVNMDFPGNIRELENIIERAVVLAEDNSVLSFRDDETPTSHILLPTDSTETTKLSDLTNNIEKQYIKKTLVSCKGNISKTAKVLGLSRAGLYKKMKRLDLVSG
ncbi:MAG: sigma-54-dependent Fis family transcriptional regulator [Candidatus Marinimicrobia bacterium]|nr:sigma-54-dependent Fis family transcriptional regulator [Candidatus Neomarinimicrobiota bacterium]